MLKSFKKKRTNSKANIQLKKVVEKKRQAKAKREVEDEGSSSDISDSSDSDYEEILISNLKKFPLPKHASEMPCRATPVLHPSEKEELPKEPLPLKREVAKPQEVNHANHFTEPITKSEPIKIEPKKKSKSKKVVIKKYYNYKNKDPKVEAPKVEEPKVEVQRVNYLGFTTTSKKNDSREHMSNRIFNW